MLYTPRMSATATAPAPTFTAFVDAVRAQADPAKAAFHTRFFKTGEGDYGAGDVFIGVTVPKLRAVVKAHRNLPMEDIALLLADPVHELRLAGLLLLVGRFEKGDAEARRAIVDFYLAHLDRVNNWDLVDSSAPQILGEWLADGNGDPGLLDELADSGKLWRERVAILATFGFIRRGDFSHTFRIANRLIAHPHDLLHKAVGWMLREVGNRDRVAEEGFLRTRYKTMPRTMLRYAIEKFPEETRKQYLKGEIL